MEPLIKITSSPMQMKYQIEPARLENQKPTLPKYEITHRPARLRVDSQNVQVSLNTKAAYRSMGFYGAGDWAREYGRRGQAAADQADGEAAQMGNAMSMIQDGVTIAQIVQSRLMQNPAMAVHTFMPAVGPEISWTPDSIDMEYSPDALEFDWQTQRSLMNYVPGKFSMEILQYPKVSIEYLGGINYVPPSADPEYEEASA